MDWDQRAFAWLYRSFRRVTGSSQSTDAHVSPLESMTARFETLSNLLTGTKWEVVAGRGMGGAGPGRLILPQSVAWLVDPEEQASFYLYRVVVGVTSSELGFVAGHDWSNHRRALAMLIAAPSIHRRILARYPGAASLVDRCTAISSEHFQFDEQSADLRCFSNACRAICDLTRGFWSTPPASRPWLASSLTRRRQATAHGVSPTPR